MNTWLWIGQILLALIFGGAGLTKLRSSRADLRRNAPWVDNVEDWVPRLTGAAELAGAVGVILPGLFDVAPVLVGIAAGSLAVIMALAAFVHLVRREFVPYVLINAVLFGLAALVAWGRIEDTPL